jgi:hypothetical protein
MCEYIKIILSTNTIRNFLRYDYEKVTLYSGEYIIFPEVLVIVMKNMPFISECLPP